MQQRVIDFGCVEYFGLIAVAILLHWVCYHEPQPSMPNTALIGAFDQGE